MRRRSPWLLCLLAAAALGACHKDAPWRGWAHPSAVDAPDGLDLGQFQTLEACRAHARFFLSYNYPGEAGDYVCGYQCKWNKDEGVNHCARTTA